MTPARSQVRRRAQLCLSVDAHARAYRHALNEPLVGCMMNHLRVTNHITLVAEAPGGVTARVSQRSGVGAPSRTAPRRARVYIKGWRRLAANKW